MLVVLGLALAGVGAAGVAFAPAIVAAQGREGMTPYDDAPIDDDERVLVTKATGVAFVLLGVGLAAYGLV